MKQDRKHQPDPSPVARAFGHDGGWQIERRTSRVAKQRERSWLYQQGLRGQRIARQATEPLPICPCGKQVPRRDPFQSGPQPAHCSTRCYNRAYYLRRGESIRAGLRLAYHLRRSAR